MLMNDKIMFDRYHCITKLYVTLRSKLPGKPVPDGLQERPSLGPLGNTVKNIVLYGNEFIHHKEHNYRFKNVPNARVATNLLYKISHYHKISFYHWLCRSQNVYKKPILVNIPIRR